MTATTPSHPLPLTITVERLQPSQGHGYRATLQGGRYGPHSLWVPSLLGEGLGRLRVHSAGYFRASLRPEETGSALAWQVAELARKDPEGRASLTSRPL